MPLPQWPTSLPCPLRSGYAWTPRSLTARTSFGGPRDDVTKLYSGSVLTAPHHVIVDRNQISALRAWVRKYEPDINWVLLQANIGDGVQFYEARIFNLDIPRDLTAATHWTVPFEIEIRAKADGSYWDYSDEDADVVLDGFVYDDDGFQVTG